MTTPGRNKKYLYLKKTQKHDPVGNTIRPDLCFFMTEISRNRKFAFTAYKVEEVEALKNSKPEYICWGVETCPTTKRIHYQGYIAYKNGKTLQQLKNKARTTHFEVAKGNPEQNIKYCSKDGEFTEFGDRPKCRGQTKEHDLVMNLSSSELLRSHPLTWARYHRAITARENLLAREKRRYETIEVIWCYGDTGTGKSRYAFEQGAVPVIYNNGFFSDWGDATVLALEEFRGNIPYSLLLALTDGYHGYHTVNIKGGQKIIDIDKIIITSPFEPWECYPNLDAKDKLEQLTRRITKTLKFPLLLGDPPAPKGGPFNHSE